MSREIVVRPFSCHQEFETMVDYFLNADNAFLYAMRIDRAKFSKRQDWLARILADQENPDDRKARFYLAWLVEGRHVGHCSVNNIQIGYEAIIHMHLYEREFRKQGVGLQLFKNSIDFYFNHFKLKKIVCEPFSDNPAPNRMLQKLGFELVKSYKTTPTPISFEQVVNRYELKGKS